MAVELRKINEKKQEFSVENKVKAARFERIWYVKKRNKVNGPHMHIS